jgi:virginiamycin B lyase
LVDPLDGFVETAKAQAIQEFPTPAHELPNPWGITKGSDGALWFTEGTSADGSNKIGRITTSGTITEFPIAVTLILQQGIAAGPDGALWFTIGGPLPGKIGRITISGSVTSFNLPTPTAEPGSIAAGPDGALWFVEGSSGKLGRITTGGGITEFPTRNGSTPRAISPGPDGAIGSPTTALAQSAESQWPEMLRSSRQLVSHSILRPAPMARCGSHK